jgi:hypothetical protein
MGDPLAEILLHRTGATLIVIETDALDYAGDFFGRWSAVMEERKLVLRLTQATVHTPTMTLKNAALLALIGTILMTALLVWTFVLTLLNVLRDLVPAVTLFQSFIYAFGCFSVMVFFFVFHRGQQS